MEDFMNSLEKYWNRKKGRNGDYNTKNWVPGYLSTDLLKKIQRFTRGLIGNDEEDIFLRYSFADVYLLDQPFYNNPESDQKSSIYRCIATATYPKKHEPKKIKRNTFKEIKSLIRELKKVNTSIIQGELHEDENKWLYFRYFLISIIRESFDSSLRKAHNFYANADVVNTFFNFFKAKKYAFKYVYEISFENKCQDVSKNTSDESIKKPNNEEENKINSDRFLKKYRSGGDTFKDIKNLDKIISSSNKEKIDAIATHFLDFLLDEIDTIDFGFLSYMFNQYADTFYPWGTSMSIPENMSEISIKYPQEILGKDNFYENINFFTYKICEKKYERVLERCASKNGKKTIHSLVVVPISYTITTNVKVNGFMRFFNRHDKSENNTVVITEKGLMEAAIKSDKEKFEALIGFLNKKLDEACNKKPNNVNVWNCMNSEIDPKMRNRTFEVIAGWYEKFDFDLKKEIEKIKNEKLHILDVGCGTGQFIKTLSQHEIIKNFGKNVALHGIDLEVTALKENTSDTLEIEIFNDDFLNYDFGTKKYNLINAMSVIAYMNDGLGAIEKIFNLLRVNNVAIIYLLKKDRDICFDLEKVIKNINKSNQNIGTFEIKNFVKDRYDKSRHFYEDSCLLIIRKKKQELMKNPYKHIKSFNAITEKVFEAYIKTGIYKNEEDSIMPFYDLNESDCALLQKTIAAGFPDLAIRHLVSHFELKRISFDKKQYDQLITFLRESDNSELANLARCIEENLAKPIKKNHES